MKPIAITKTTIEVAGGLCAAMIVEAIRKYADEEGYVYWTVKELRAKVFGAFSPPTIEKTLADLQTRGIVSIERDKKRFAGRRYKVNGHILAKIRHGRGAK